MLPDVSPADVPTLIPNAPEPQQVHVDLARIWVTQYLATRGYSLATLTADQVLLLRLAIAARALSLMAGMGGVITLGKVAQGVNQIKVGPIEVKLTSDSYGNAVTVGADWERYALDFLALLFPVRRYRWVAGASR